MPTTDVTYTLRVRYEVTDSKMGDKAIMYDYMSLRLRPSCAEFTWTAATGAVTYTDPTFTYNVLAVAQTTGVLGTMTVALPLIASTTCDDSPTVTWFFTVADSGDWTALIDGDSHPMVATVADGAITFDGAMSDWVWGSSETVIEKWKVVYTAASPTTAVKTVEFDVKFTNGCYDDTVTAMTSITQIDYTYLLTQVTTDDVTSDVSTATWDTSNCSEIYDLQIFDSTIPGWVTTGMNDTAIFGD